MANLGPLYQNQTYSNLLQIDGGLSAELKKVLDGDGNESGLSLSFNAASITGLVSESANNLYGGLPGTVAYQSSANNTAFTLQGTAGYVLASNGANAPYWTNIVPYATYATYANELTGGSAGQIPYQTALNDTSFVAVGTAGQVLVSGGTAAPYWSSSVPAAGTANTANDIAGGAAGNLLYQDGAGSTTYVTNGLNGQYLKSQGALAPVWDTLSASDVGAVPIDGSTAMTGSLNLGSFRITNVGSPSSSTDAANKAYVDAAATGLKIKTACVVATTATISLSNLQTIDGVSLAALDRVLVKNQTDSTENGIYVVVDGGDWIRALDADTWSELYGATTFITSGSTNANSTWACNITSTGTLGTDAITFVLFGASAAYTAGTGLSLVGSQFSLSTPVTVANGGTGAATLTGILKGNGTSAFSVASAADIVGAIGATAVQNATTSTACTGNALTATTLQNIRTINGIAFNGSANITINADTNYAITFADDGLGNVSGTSWNGNAAVKVSWNTIGAVKPDGSNATSGSTWNINVDGVSAGFKSGVVLEASKGGTGQDRYAVGDLLYASTTANLSKLAIASTDYVLRGGTTPTWGKVELNTTLVTGTLPVTRGGTGLPSVAANYTIYTTGADNFTAGTLPIVCGGTNATTAAGARVQLLPSYSGNALKVLRLNSTGSDVEWAAASTGTVTSVAMTVPTGLAISGSPVTSSGTLAISFASGYSIPTTASQTNWNTAYSDRLKWDGGSTGLSASTGRASLGLGNVAVLNYPGGTSTFLRADGTWQTPSTGTVTSVATSGAITGGTITTTGTISHSTADGYLHVPATGTTNNGKVLTAGSTAGSLSWQTPSTSGGGWSVSGSTSYTSNNVILNSAFTAPITSGDAQYCNAQFAKGGQNTVGSIVGAFQSSNDNSASGFYAFKTRNTDPNAQTTVITGDDIGEFGAHGSDGARYVKNAFITFVMEGNAYSSGGNSYSPCGINFWTRDQSLGSASSYSPALKRALVIDSNQNVGVTVGKFSIGLNPSSGAPLNGSYKFTHETSATGIAAATYYVGSTGGGSVINTNNGVTSTVPVYGFWYDQNTGLGNPAASNVSIITNSVEQVRFFNNTRTSFGTSTAPTYLTHAVKNYYGTNVWAFGPDTTDFYVTQNSGSYLGVKLTWGATSWTTASDETIKKDLLPIENGLNKVNTLRAVTGKFIDDDTNAVRPFLIAQDLIQVLPEAVDSSDGQPMGIRYTEVIPLLVAAIKELSAKVEALENANNG